MVVIGVLKHGYIPCISKLTQSLYRDHEVAVPNYRSGDSTTNLIIHHFTPKKKNHVKILETSIPKSL